MVAFSNRIDQKLIPQKIKLQFEKLGQMDENTAKNCHLYAPISQTLFSKSKSHSLSAAHEQKTSLAQKKLVHTAI